MLECVPNFSEGQNPAVVDGIVDAISSAPGVLVLGSESDSDHNRSVVTFAAPEDAIAEGALRGVGKAAQLIDLSRHQGVHPRVGATDVLPFIPLEGSTMADAIRVAHEAGREIWRRFGIPAYFYEQAALSPARRRLEKTRRSGFDGNPPDIGDIPTHPTAGASMVGAREFLIAYNVDLSTSDASIAQAIARKIRESAGGFRHVKAMGLYLASHGCAQVSMNLTNFAETPLEAVYQAIREEARLRGTDVASCELIGFVPRRAYQGAPEFFRRARNFDESRVIESRIEQLLR